MKNKQYIPEPDLSVFKDPEKEAKFWEENFDKVKRKPIKVKFAKKLKHIYLNETINIRLDSITLETVKSKAQKAGLGPTQLIRMWIMEKINSI